MIMLILYVLASFLGASPGLHLTTLSAVETRTDGQWQQYDRAPGACDLTPIAKGSRLRVQTQTRAKMHLYAVAVDDNRSYWLLAKRKPTTQRVRQIWPGGYYLTAKDVRMQTLLVVASEKPIETLDSLKTAHCPQWKAQYPPKEPKTLCDHLGTLSREAPRRIRGCVEPTTDLLYDGSTALLGIQSQNKGSKRVVTERQFRVLHP